MTGGPLDILLAFEAGGSGPVGADRMARRAVDGLVRRGLRVSMLNEPSTRPAIVHYFDLARPNRLADALRIADQTGAGLAITPCSTSRVWPDAEQGRDACRAADVVFALTEVEAVELRDIGVAADRIRMVPSASDLVGRPDAAGFRRRLGLEHHVVLFAGRRVATKGYVELLHATTLVWQRMPQVAFVFLGPNGDSDAARHFRAHADPRVLDLGVVDEQTKHDAIDACDLLCLPSSADVFPLVFIEAWLCGRAVLSGTFAGAHEVVRHGVDGVVVPPRPEPLAEAIVALLGDDERRAAMGRAGRERARRELGWSRVAAEYEAGYREAIDARTRRER
jgi:glycosyltransferase involved in cell wall biosynthesis